MVRKIVAHIRDRYLGLSETFIYNYLVHFERYRPILLTRRINNLDLFPFADLYSPSKPKMDILRKLGYETWRLLASQAGIIPTFYDAGRRYFVDVVSKERAQLIHAHFGQEGVRMLHVKRSTGLPLLTTFYGYDMSILPKRLPGLWRRHYAELFAQGDRFLVEGNHMRRSLVALGCPEAKIRIQHIGVNIEQFQLVPRRLQTGDNVRILFCARLIEKKGLIYALQALEQVAQDLSGWELRVIGDGPLRKQLQMYAARAGLEPHVTWLGYQPHYVFAKELEHAHIFIQPSVTSRNGDSEGGAPTTLLEAQASGIPVLATFHADIPEVVLDQGSGYLVPEHDVDALTQKLLYLATHPEIWPSMGRTGRHHIEQNYEIRTVTRSLETLYDECLVS